MARVKFIERKFRGSTKVTIGYAIRIIDEYARQGFRLTLRQLYYQFVARGLCANTPREYDRLGAILGDARMAGLVDWDAIEDRTRNLDAPSHWADASEILRSAATSFRADRWAEQDVRVEVWVEKEALAGVFAGVCDRLDVPLMACRGYMSLSEMYAAAERLRETIVSEGKEVVILHFGDHDPSGIDMTRDIRDRLGTFLVGEAGRHAAELEVRRMALTFDQVEAYDPPPNPAKTTDSRFDDYVRRYGDESWELDALEPSVLISLVEDEILSIVDEDRWAEAEAYEEREKEKILDASRRLRSER